MQQLEAILSYTSNLRQSVRATSLWFRAHTHAVKHDTVSTFCFIRKFGTQTGEGEICMCWVQKTVTMYVVNKDCVTQCKWLPNGSEQLVQQCRAVWLATRRRGTAWEKTVAMCCWSHLRGIFEKIPVHHCGLVITTVWPAKLVTQVIWHTPSFLCTILLSIEVHAFVC